MASRVVTSVDLKAQEIILSHVGDSGHDFGVLTEESKDDHSRAVKDYFWCIDPLDGTLPFIEGRSGYAVSIALISKSGDPVIGVVYLPDSASCYSSVRGKGVFLNSASFSYDTNKSIASLDVYADRSLLKEPYYNKIISNLGHWIETKGNGKLRIHQSYGAVCNAIGVMNSDIGCYFKFPKQRNGGGSIWDFAATRLFFEELGLFVSNANGGRLHLNNLNTTFMNESGVIYSNNQALSEYILSMEIPKDRHPER